MKYPKELLRAMLPPPAIQMRTRFAYAWRTKRQVTAAPRYGGMRFPLAMGASASEDVYPAAFQTPDSGQIDPVRAVVPIGARAFAYIGSSFRMQGFTGVNDSCSDLESTLNDNVFSKVP